MQRAEVRQVFARIPELLACPRYCLLNRFARETDIRDAIRFHPLKLLLNDFKAQGHCRYTGFTNSREAGDEMQDIKRLFTPEFRNRLDAVCKFQSLDQLSYRKIVAKFVRELNDLLSERQVSVTATERLIDHIIAVGVDAKMGARPLARKVDDLIKLPLSKRLLFDEVPVSGRLVLDWVDDQLTIEEQNSVSEIA